MLRAHRDQIQRPEVSPIQNASYIVSFIFLFIQLNKRIFNSPTVYNYARNVNILNRLQANNAKIVHN